MGLSNQKIGGSTQFSQTAIDWAQVSRFHQERDRVVIQQEKELVEQRKKDVKAVLDK
jgi:hypothetical protein